MKLTAPPHSLAVDVLDNIELGDDHARFHSRLGFARVLVVGKDLRFPLKVGDLVLFDGLGLGPTADAAHEVGSKLVARIHEAQIVAQLA